MAKCSKTGVIYAVVVAAMIMLLAGSSHAQIPIALHAAQGLEVETGLTIYEDSESKDLRIGLYYGTSPRRTWHIQATQRFFSSKWSIIGVGVASRRFANNSNAGYWWAGRLYGGYRPAGYRSSYGETGGLIGGGIIGRLSAESNTTFFAGGKYGIGVLLDNYTNWRSVFNIKAGLVGMEFNIGMLKMEAMVTISLESRTVGYSIASYF